MENISRDFLCINKELSFESDSIAFHFEFIQYVWNSICYCKLPKCIVVSLVPSFATIFIKSEFLLRGLLKKFLVHVGLKQLNIWLENNIWYISNLKRNTAT